MTHPTANAPLYEALQALAARDTARFHMPGHKGKPIFDAFARVFPLDFTETYGTGNLYEGTGPIRAAETRAAALYRAADCHFLTGGSTQGVHAMLYAACGAGSAVALDRSAHKSTLSACALFDLAPHFVYPESAEPFGFRAHLAPDEVDDLLRAHPEIRALLIVSPNYYGVRQDVPALAAVCRRHGRLLLVDAAHGAHFPALGLPSPIEEGADAAVLSAHKTLPALGQGAYLLFADTMDGARLREGAAMVGTSSPSYPILASLDLARVWLEGVGGEAYRATALEGARLRDAIAAHTPFSAVTPQDFPDLDPCRLTVCTAATALTGHALADALFARHGVACEMADDRNAVFILSGADSALDLMRLLRALVREGKRTHRTDAPAPVPPLPPAARALSVRQAWFSPRENVPLTHAAGRVCACAVTPYPPGIPLLWPGEKITDAHIEFLLQRCYTKAEQISVICL